MMGGMRTQGSVVSHGGGRMWLGVLGGRSLLDHGIEVTRVAPEVLGINDGVGDGTVSFAGKHTFDGGTETRGFLLGE